MGYIHAIISNWTGISATKSKKDANDSDSVPDDGDNCGHDDRQDHIDRDGHSGGYRPVRIFSVTKDPQSNKTTVHLVAVEYQREIPQIFIGSDGNNVNVYGIWQQGQEKYPCPREGTDNNVLVMTNRGIFLFCYGCGEFYAEGGAWGYKTSWAAFERMKVQKTAT